MRTHAWIVVVSVDGKTWSLSIVFGRRYFRSRRECRDAISRYRSIGLSREGHKRIRHRPRKFIPEPDK